MNDELNSKAYNDVFNWNDPQYPDNETYMQYYHFWYSKSPMKQRDDMDFSDYI